MSGLEYGESLDVGDPLAVGRRRRWLPRITLLTLLLALVLIGLILLGWLARTVNASVPPTSLAVSRLEGPRGPACIRMVAAEDVSGSMSDFASARESAFAMLVGWAPQNLRSDDEFAVITFAADAHVRQEPVAVPALGTLRPGPSPQGGSTNLDPVVERIADMPDSDCDVALLLFSDGQFNDASPDADRARALLQSAQIHDVILLVPSPEIDIPAEWTEAFPQARPVVFDGLSADETSITLGESIASLTGQQLARR